MTDAEDTVVEFDDTDDNRTDGSDDAELLDGADELIERLLAGDDPAPDAPAWCADLALLVQAARAPATPDELADEAALVRAMSVVRLTAVGLERAGRPDEPDVGRIVALPATVPDDLDVDDRAPVALDALAGVTDLGAHRRRAGGRYTAKHAAARLEASRHPVARTLGRALAMKAAAVTTAAVVGVAAAAATTGIVATVVVPAFEKDEPRPTTTTTEGRTRTTTTVAGDDAREPSADAGVGAAGCPAPAPCPTDPAGTAPRTSPTVTAPVTTATTEPTDRTTTSENTTTTVDTPTTTVPATTTSSTPTTTTGDPPPGQSPVEPTSAPLVAGPSALDGAGDAP